LSKGLITTSKNPKILIIGVEGILLGLQKIFCPNFPEKRFAINFLPTNVL